MLPEEDVGKRVDKKRGGGGGREMYIGCGRGEIRGKTGSAGGPVVLID